PVRPQFKHFQKLGDPAMLGLRRNAVEIADEAQEFKTRQLWIDERLVGNKTDSPFGLDAISDNVPSGDVRRPGTGIHQPCENLDGRRLAGPVGTEKAEYFAFSYVKINIIYGGELAEAFGQAAQLDQATKTSSPTLRSSRKSR